LGKRIQEIGHQMNTFRRIVAEIKADVPRPLLVWLCCLIGGNILALCALSGHKQAFLVAGISLILVPYFGYIIFLLARDLWEYYH
jgi:hypothetical protein